MTDVIDRTEVEAAAVVEGVALFKESLKAARYGNYEPLINDDNEYSQNWRRKRQQIQTLNTLLTPWMTAVLPFMNALPTELIPCLQTFFDQWLDQNKSIIVSSVVCGYYACECMILLAQGPIGKIREVARTVLIPLARRLTEMTWQAVLEEQKLFTFSSLPLCNSLGSFISQDFVLLVQNARQVGENLKGTLEELFLSNPLDLSI